MKLRSGFRIPSRGWLFSRQVASVENLSKIHLDDRLYEATQEKDHDIVWRRASITRVTHLCMSIQAILFFIVQVGVLPHLSARLNISTFNYGLLESLFAVMQLMGGPLFGRLGDMYGSRFAMLLAFMSASLCYFLVGLSTNVVLLFLSRLAVVFMHPSQGGQMVITDISEPERRADALGKLGVSFAVGMIIGPVLGGQLVKHIGENATALLASVAALISSSVALLGIPRNIHKDPKSPTEPAKKKEILNMSKWKEILRYPVVWVLLVSKGFVVLPFSSFHPLATMVFIKEFGLEPQQCGLVFSYVGFIIMFNQGFFVGQMTKRYSESSLIRLSTFCLIFTWMLFSCVANVWQFCLVMIPQSFCFAIQNTVVNSVLTKSVPPNDTGAMLGLSATINSLVRIAAPALGGFLLNNIGFYSFGVLGTFMCSAMTMFQYTMLPHIEFGSSREEKARLSPEPEEKPTFKEPFQETEPRETASFM